MINLNYLKEKLKEKNLNQKELAEKLQITEASISSWKRGIYPQVNTLIKICQILDVSADELLELKPKPPNEITGIEKRLIENYRLSDDRGKNYILEVAENESKRNNPNLKSSDLSAG